MPDLARYEPFLADLRSRPHFKVDIEKNMRFDEPLGRYTVAQLGGAADILFTAHDGHFLSTLAQLCWRHNVPMRILGGGANVLISDAGYRGVILINKMDSISIIEGKSNAAQTMVAAASGVKLASLTRFTIEHGLSGFEWAVSVPGTVGGAVVNNAGAHGSDIAANMVNAELYVYDKPSTLWPLKKLNYSYRESALKHSPLKYVVLAACFQFSPVRDPTKLRAHADEYVAHRKQTQPPGASLGSMFKNPPGDYAGRLIEAAGLKGARAGGVIISPIHANFFVNTGGGTASDYLALIRLAQNTVREKFGIELELEIELIGEGFER